MDRGIDPVTKAIAKRPYVGVCKVEQLALMSSSRRENMANKIDPIGFACLISKVAAIRGEELYSSLVTEFHDLVIDSVIEQTVQQPYTVLPSQLDEMLKAIQEGKKIEAIKAYRQMTGFCDLKQAKDAIEKYWYVNDLNKEIFAAQ